LIATNYSGWIGSILLPLEEDFQFAALLQPLVDIEEAIWNSPAALTIRSRLHQHLIRPGVSRQHAHLSSPLDGKPLIDPKRIHLIGGEFDQIVPGRPCSGWLRPGVWRTWKSCPKVILATWQ
jgi:hypothetical protein